MCVPAVDVHQRIQFREHDIDIVGTDTCGQRRYAFPTERTGVCHELAVLPLVFHAVETLADERDTPGVAHDQDQVAQLFGLQGNMVNAAVRVQDELAGCEWCAGLG